MDAKRVLTCAHVVMRCEKIYDQLSVAFPQANTSRPDRYWVEGVQVIKESLVDLAVLTLAAPVPLEVSAAPLLRLAPSYLAGSLWWAFGFPNGDPRGNSANGSVGEALGYGWLRLDTMSRYVVEPGFSGAGLWSPQYQAVVGLVAKANQRGDGQAITFWRIAKDLPGQNLCTLAHASIDVVGEAALSAWGWTLDTDPEGRRHWRPRSRGVAVDTEKGWRFRGRRAALSRIVQWLEAPERHREVLVVTGSPGVGKSAVLGRIVTTADAGIAAVLPPDDEAVRASVGSIACAVHAKGKTALEVASEIARAASAERPERVEDLLPLLREALEGCQGLRFSVVIDALDEASTPTHARNIIKDIAVPLMETCVDLGVRIVVGTRRQDDGGSLLDVFGLAAVLVDLDEPKYFALEDLISYADATLRMTSDEGDDNLYGDPQVSRPLSTRIAELSQGNYLIAGLIARAHGLHDKVPADPRSLSFSPTVDFALATYLDRLPPMGQVSPRTALMALAFAEPPGLPVELWSLAITALGGQASTNALREWADTAVANFLVESSSGEQARVYRLFHQALNDVLLHGRNRFCPEAEDQRALARVFLEYGKTGGWAEAPSYLLRALPGHADIGGMIDDLLAEDSYLLHADLNRLNSRIHHARTTEGESRARLLHRTPYALSALPAARAAMFSITETLDHLGSSYTKGECSAPYRAEWAATIPRMERNVLEGHTARVSAVCSVTVDERFLLASAGYDRTVRIWDPATGLPLNILEGHSRGVVALCGVEVCGRTLLASAGGDEKVRLWDPATGLLQMVLEGHSGWVSGLCTVKVGGRTFLTSAGEDQTVRMWDPVTGEPRSVFKGHTGWVSGLCTLEVGGRALLASAGSDETVRLWDPTTGLPLNVLEGHSRGLIALCGVEVDGRALLAYAGRDKQVQILDPAAGEPVAILEGHTEEVNGLCAVQVGERTLLASGGSDRTVRLWDPLTGLSQAVLEGHTWGVNAVCEVEVDGSALLVSASDDKTVRIWDPGTGLSQPALGGDPDWVHGICAVKVGGRTLLASAGNEESVRIWDALTGAFQGTLKGHTDWVSGVCALEVDGRTLLASAGNDETVRIWDPVTKVLQGTLKGHTDWVTGVCALEVDQRTLLASAGDDWTVRIWDPVTKALEATLEGHFGAVTGVCALEVDGYALLASAGIDGTARIWDPLTEELQATLEGHTDGLHGVCAVKVDGCTLLASAGHDETVRIWDPLTEELQATMKGHTGAVLGVCVVEVGERTLLASAGDDRTVRIWDPLTGLLLSTIPVHHPAASCTSHAPGHLAIGLSAGVLAIKIESVC